MINIVAENRKNSPISDDRIKVEHLKLLKIFIIIVQKCEIRVIFSSISSKLVEFRFKQTIDAFSDINYILPKNIHPRDSTYTQNTNPIIETKPKASYAVFLFLYDFFQIISKFTATLDCILHSLAWPGVG